MIGEGAAIDSYILAPGVADPGIKRDSVVLRQLSHGQDRFIRATADHISPQFIRLSSETFVHLANRPRTGGVGSQSTHPRLCDVLAWVGSQACALGVEAESVRLDGSTCMKRAERGEVKSG